MADTIEFNHIAKEWRMKYAENGLSGGAVLVDKLFKEKYLDTVKALEGCVSVQRAVCGGCNDFKIVIKMTKDGFGKWEANQFSPEAEFFEAVKGIEGISQVESQPLTWEELFAADSKQASKKEGKKKENKKEAAPAKAAAKEESPEEARKALLKKVIKEGGKRGVEIEGAADMGGLQFFCTAVEFPDGDAELLVESMKAMNEKSDPTEEERKGGSGHIGKMIFSAGGDQLAIMAYVPKEKQSEVSSEEWLKKVLELFSGELLDGGVETSVGRVKADGDKNIFPLKIREPMILEANNFLRKKGLFPEDHSDSDEMVFGDDDFPS